MSATDKPSAAMVAAWAQSGIRDFPAATRYMAFCHGWRASRTDLLVLLAEVRDACLIGDDDGITVTSEPTIDESLFDRICAALSAPTASPADRPALPRDASLQPPGGLK